MHARDLHFLLNHLCTAELPGAQGWLRRPAGHVTYVREPSTVCTVYRPRGAFVNRWLRVHACVPRARAAHGAAGLCPGLCLRAGVFTWHRLHICNVCIRVA